MTRALTLLFYIFLATASVRAQQVRSIDLRNGGQRALLHVPETGGGCGDSGSGPSRGLNVTLLSVDNDRYSAGDTIDVLIRITNKGQKAVALPASVERADVEPNEVSKGYSFRELNLQLGLLDTVSPPTTRAFVPLQGALYGSESNHSLIDLAPGESLAVRASGTIPKIHQRSSDQLGEHLSANLKLRAQLQVRTHIYTPGSKNIPSNEREVCDADEIESFSDSTIQAQISD